MEYAGVGNTGMNGEDSTPLWEVWEGDAFDLLDKLKPETVDLLITSPPYWGLRSYGLEHNWEIWKEWTADHGKSEIPPYEWYREHGGRLGLEPTPDWYAWNLTSILSKAWRVLKPRGNVWRSLGVTYFARWARIRP